MADAPTTKSERQGLRPLYPIAENHGGYFTPGQAEDVGVSRRMLSHWVAQGAIKRVGRGIYRLVQFPAQPHEDVIVACLWAGPDAAASHQTALTVYGITDAMPSAIHITVPHPFAGKRRGVLVHHAPLAQDDTTIRNSVPVTTIERAIADIALSDPVLAAQAIQEAIDQGLISRRQGVGLARSSQSVAREIATDLLMRE